MHTLRAPPLQGLILSFARFAKLCEMICEIIVCKTVCGIFLNFCRWNFINNFTVKKHFSGLQNHRNLNISRTIYLKKFPHNVLKVISAKMCWKNFFFEKTFFKDLEYFSRLQNHCLGLIFYHNKLILYFFSSVII